MPSPEHRLDIGETSKAGRSRTNPGPKTCIQENRSVDHIVQILKKGDATGAWLDSGKGNDPELFVLLAHKLPDAERHALTAVAHAVIPHNGNPAKRIAELEQENQRLRSLSLTDGLTGLYNYRFFAKQLEIEMTRTRRTGQPCSLIMIDLDDFKLLNDTCGHDEGNKYLVTVTRTIQDKLRPTDILCRYGGDEFAVIMPATYLFDAMRIARRLRNTITRIPPKLEAPFSASLGVAEYDPSSGQEMSVFVKTADKALYGAKKGGKNRICYAGKLPKIGKTAPVTQDEKAALLFRGQHKKG
jgi:diguanylate cyclase (GGDEF)-like protein